MNAAGALEFGIMDETVVNRPPPDDENGAAGGKGDGKKKD